MPPPSPPPTAPRRADPPAWARWAPAAALGLFAAVAAAFRIRSGDLFWHLAAGRWILEQRAVPRTDPFRFTSGDRPWVDHEWLFQVLVHGVERLGGLDGLVALRVGLVLLLALALHRTQRRIGLDPALAAGVAALALLGARPRFLIRPELPTLILLTLLLHLLRRERADPRPARLVALVALTLLWVNLHGAAILAPVVAALYLLGSRWDPGPPLPGSRSAAIPALLFLALLANPYGWRILLVAAGIGEAMRDLPAYNPEWVPAWISPQPFLFAGVVAVAAVAAAGLRRGRIDAGGGLVTAVLTVVAASAVRHQALFYVAAVPFVAATLVRLGAGAPGASPRRRAALATTVALLATLWCLAPPPAGPLQPRQGRFQPGLDVEPGRFPERAADLLSRHPEVGPLYNTFAWGGYLLWRLHPPRRVFHDGRMELAPGLLREIAAARRSDAAWSALLDRHGAVGGLVRYDERRRPVFEPGPSGRLRRVGTSTANTLLFPRETYALVHWDDAGMLFLDRAAGPPPELLAREYRWIDPEDIPGTLRRAARDPEALAGALAEVERKLAEEPGCRRAQRLREALMELVSGR